MWTTEDHTVAAGHSVTPTSWQTALEELLGRVAGRFARVEPRRRARAFVLGLLADLPRKNCWTIAEHAGDASPDGLQHLLAGAVWDHDAVRDDIRDWLVEHLADPAGVLVVDETGDLKKGASTVGVQRQYTGTAGKVDNAQVAVYLAYATTIGHGVIDRELYLPQGWIDDPARCHAAGVPDLVGFATKPELARVMLERALDAGVPAGWVTADEVYGGSPALRGWLETRQLPYVLAVKATEPLPPASGSATAAARLAEQIPPACWLRLGAGQGAKGRRWYGWARLPLATAGAPTGWGRWLLVRRSLRTGELAYYLCAGPAGLPLVALVQVAGTRWRVEEALAGQQGAVRPGPAPGPPLVLLVPVGDPGHAGLRVLGGGRGHRPRPPSTTVGPHPADLQRNPAPVRHTRRRPRHSHRPPVALVVVATPPASPRPRLPLPPAGQRTVKITNSGWSIRSARRRSIGLRTCVTPVMHLQVLCRQSRVEHRIVSIWCNFIENRNAAYRPSPSGGSMRRTSRLVVLVSVLTLALLA